MNAAAAIATGASWREALEAALTQIEMPAGASIDLAFLFASPQYAPHYAELLAEARRALAAGVIVGCSGQGVIGPEREIEDEAAISLLAFSLPGAEIEALHVSQAAIGSDSEAAAWRRQVQAGDDVSAWVILADPFSLDPDRLLAVLTQAFPEATLVGGLASGDVTQQQTHLFLDGEVFDEGAIAIAIGGAYTVRTVVSQGAEPIGEPWTVTAVHANVVETLGMRPALDILIETLRSLPPETQDRAQRNLLIGLAMDEYRDDFRRGDFLIRNLMGVDRERGVIAVNALPRVGQTLQFQVRDPAAADSELVELLDRAKMELGGGLPVGALLYACNGRGVGLFGAPDHDARTISERLGPLPLAGFFCNGEIGPVGKKPFLHGFTASIALIVPKSGSD